MYIAAIGFILSETNTGFVKMLYDNALGRVSDDGGLNDWETALNNGTITLGSVVYDFVFSKELGLIISPASPEDFITSFYFRVLWIKEGLIKRDFFLQKRQWK